MSNSNENFITQICKRSGEIAPFEQEKITNAIANAARAVGDTEEGLAEDRKSVV